MMYHKLEADLLQDKPLNDLQRQATGLAGIEQSKNGKTACRHAWREMFLTYGGETIEQQQAYLAGFITGLAEKVWLGACLAAMVHPTNDDWADFQAAVLERACAVYGLRWMHYVEADELWLYRDANAEMLLDRMRQKEINSKAWHTIRAILCGVPHAEIDHRYHERYEG